MKSLLLKLVAFVLCALTGCGSARLVSSETSSAAIAPLPIVQTTSIDEITMQVYNDWCGGNDCPDYKIVFQRQGSADYYSSVTRIATRTGAVELGYIYREEYDRLAKLIEAQSFFDLDAVYPKDSGCADCVFTTVTVMRDGRRKRVVQFFGDLPLQLFTIHRAIEGASSHVQWLKK